MQMMGAARAKHWTSDRSKPPASVDIGYHLLEA
jgi:hypothetical protein